jgi:Fe-S-cluster-containing hydrogenase component 2/CRP-like cAMP-binding protein/thioredoxin reductase
MELGQFRIAILGAGPAGLSAAARAAALDADAGAVSPSYVLLEAFALPAKTVQRYQKGKHVMAEPGYLDLRSDMNFVAGKREEVLARWVGELARHKVNARFNSEVKTISGSKGNFRLALSSGDTLNAGAVVLAVGVGGNPRPLNVPGEERPEVQYQLDDPEAYRDERILVVGAGDAAIENALALAGHNAVTIVNRGAEFSRAKDGNLRDVLAALTNPKRRLQCLYEAKVTAISGQSEGDAPLAVVVDTANGEVRGSYHRIIARLGAEPPRKFLESIGIRFPSARADSIPELTSAYETNVPGLYIIGSLAGSALIKQAMNQGYDVVEYLHGHKIEPADHKLLEYRFYGLPFQRSVEDSLQRFKAVVPMFREINALAFREFIIESEVIAAYPPGVAYEEASERLEKFSRSDPSGGAAARATRVIREGDAVYEAGEFSTSFYTIVQGEVRLESPGGAGATLLERGDFFGELSLLSGRPRLDRAIAGRGCIVVETPRRIMLKLLNSNDDVRSGIDWIFVVRELQRHFAPQASLRRLKEIAARLKPKRWKAGERIVAEGEPGASLYMVRSGGVVLYRGRDQHMTLVGRMQAGQSFGETTLMGDAVRRETAQAVVATELVEIGETEFLELMELGGGHVKIVQRGVSDQVKDSARMAVRPEAGSVLAFMMREGLGEATNVLVIDETRCTGCDNCERACAETHAGVSRLDRRSGASFAQVHIPVACRHCEQPHCMKDCPPNAIRRAETGEVYIDDSCIGCGNCQLNCPYGVIRMGYEAPSKPSLLSWLLLGRGPGPGEEQDYQPVPSVKAKGVKALKCDACIGSKAGPACVQACPTGAAVRIGPSSFADLAAERQQ